jgi:hypothetical protein
VNVKSLLFAVAGAALLAGGCTKEEPVKASAPPASANKHPAVSKSCDNRPWIM